VAFLGTMGSALKARRGLRVITPPATANPNERNWRRLT